MSLAEALNDVKAAVVAGESLGTDLFGEIAEEYGLNPKLIERKVSEAGWTESGLRAVAAATNPTKVLGDKIAEMVAEAKRLVREDRGLVGVEFHYKGEKYTYLGSRTMNQHCVVLNESAQRYVLNTPAMLHSTWKNELDKKKLAQ